MAAILSQPQCVENRIAVLVMAAKWHVSFVAECSAWCQQLNSPGGGGAGARRFFLPSVPAITVASACGTGAAAAAAAGADADTVVVVATSTSLSTDVASLLVFVLPVFMDSCEELPGDSRGDILDSSNPLECELFRECTPLVWTLRPVLVATTGGGADCGRGGGGAGRFFRCGLLGAADFVVCGGGAEERSDVEIAEAGRVFPLGGRWSNCDMDCELDML